MFILKSNTRGLAGYWTLFSEAEIITDLSGGDIFIDVEVCHNLRPVICKSFLTLDHSQAPQVRTGSHHSSPADLDMTIRYLQCVLSTLYNYIYHMKYIFLSMCIFNQYRMNF